MTTTEYPNAKDIKLIVSDVDGTLLNSESELTPQTIHIIRKVLEQYPSLKFMLSTGRAEQSIKGLREKLHLNETSRHPLSCINGCLLYSGDLKILKEFRIPKNDVVDLINFCEEWLTEASQTNYALFSGNDIYFFKKGYFYDRLHDFYKNNTICLEKETLLQKVLNEEIPINKICIFNENHDLVKNFKDKHLKPFIDQGNRLGMAQTAGHCLEVMPKDGNKGSSLQNLLQIMNIKREEVLVFGDAENDIPMFEVSGHSVAMGNAMDCLKPHAKYFTKSNNEDGLAAFLEKVFLV